MDTHNIIPVHICSLCGKPFTQERQHRRHQEYCRKVHGRPRMRSRPCRACSQAKIKCNFRAPCSHCTRKGLACVYEQQQRRYNGTDDSTVIGNASSSMRSDDIDDLGIVSPSNVLDEVLETSHDFLGFDHSGYLHNVDDVFTIPSTNMHWETLNKSKEPSTISTAPLPTEMDDFMSSLQNNNFDCLVDSFVRKDTDFVQGMPAPLLPSLTSSQVSTTAAHFSQNKAMNPVQQIFTRMLIDMIRAYPLMMTRRETFPPFVHPYCYLYEGCNTLPQVLTNAMGIAQLFVARTDDTRSFVWATIMTEVQEMVEKRLSMSKFELFSALQASLLYLIMRAIETTPQKTEHDLELIRGHEVICDYTIAQIGNHAVPEVNDPHRQWKDWIFDESVKRVAWVWFSLSLVYHIRSGAPCKVADATLGMPLPCTKTEWEAHTEADWKREYYKVRNSEATACMQTYGDLVDAHRGSPAERIAKAKQLEAWNAGIDNLGVLLNFAVYMTRD